jgi:hypothetical protein
VILLDTNFLAALMQRDTDAAIIDLHLFPRDVRQAAVRPSKPVPGVQVSRPVGRRETPHWKAEKQSPIS